MWVEQSGEEMKKFFAVRLIALALVVPHVSGKRSGAPATACVDFTPQHGGNTPQTSSSPYSITFSPATFTAKGSSVTVTLSTTSGATFKGFLLSSQYEDSCVDQSLMPGTFTPIANSQLTCSNGAVTHTSVNAENSLSFQWTPPQTSEGNIRFRATFVRQFDTFWVNVKASNVLVDSAVGAGQSKCITSGSSGTQPPSSVTSDSPAAQPLTSAGVITKDPECGSKKGCYSDCSGTDCKFLMTWAPGTSPVNIRVTISSKIGNAQNRYIAFGLSNDDEMGDDSVHFCINAAAGVFSSYNNGRSSANLINAKEGVGDITVIFQDGVLTCSFTRTKAGGAGGKLFGLDKKYTLFWAEGPGDAGGVREHSSLPLISKEAVSLQDFTVDIGGVVEYSLVKAHGSIMMVAWMFFASIGVVVARYFKHVWGSRRLLGEKIWFQIHRTCMVMCLLATITAFIIIFVDVGGYSHIEGAGFRKAHPVIGIIVTCLTVINPIMALFRPHPDSDNRGIFDWSHWAVGFAAHTLAVITMFFGVKLDKAQAPKYATYILVGFVVWQVLIQVIMGVVKYKGSNSVMEVQENILKEDPGKDASDRYEMSDVSRGSTEDKSSPQQSDSTKSLLLVVHVLASAVFTITLIVVLNVGHDH